MKIKFIGTGSMQNKSCNTSILIDDILFDIGNGVVYNLDKFDILLSEINYLVISHFHGDHFSDITNLLIARRFRKIKNKLTIIGPHGLRRRIIDFYLFLYGDGTKKIDDIEEKYNVEFVELNDGDEYVINNKILKTYKLKHNLNKEDLGYTYDNKVAYLVDTTLCDNIYNICNNIEYIFADVTDIDTSPAHIGLNDYIKLSKKYPKNNFYAIHRNDYDVKDIDRIFFPNDGDEINI